ncbi:hypothetical protein MAM1_0151c06677 [Mucor ambiguus]|uniref:Uncharacterized protein n=1 Tax=Mucor ambiguus TaxID=91626 RepID=A0A0C9MII9_9FUNG|nr:hypothetical protein MAM1_0151c06677 [Mucor ambiguus]
MLQVLLDIEDDMICHPDAEFTGKALDSSGSALLDWLRPAPLAASSSVAPAISLPDNNGIALASPHLLPH